MRVTEPLSRLAARVATARSWPGAVVRLADRSGSRLRTWAFLGGNRRHVAVLLLAFVYGVLLVAGTLWPFEMERLLTEESTVRDLLNTLLSGVILLVSIVVSVNSLVLSEELAPVGNQHERVEDAWTFRARGAAVVEDDVSPSSPMAFLRNMIDNVDREARLLARQLPAEDREVREDLAECIERVEAYVEETRAVLGDGHPLSSNVRLFAATYDPVVELDYARRLRERDSLPEDARRSLDVVISGLEFFTSAREYFKTMYFKREFARLSRDLLYAGVPAVMLMSYLILALTGNVLPGRTLWFSNLYLFFSLAYVVSLSPFFVLAAYVVRAAVIAENTISAGGFVVD